MDHPVNQVVSLLIVPDVAVWDRDTVLVDMALAGMDTGRGIAPHHVKTMPFILFRIACALEA